MHKCGGMRPCPKHCIARARAQRDAAPRLRPIAAVAVAHEHASGARFDTHLWKLLESNVFACCNGLVGRTTVIN